MGNGQSGWNHGEGKAEVLREQRSQNCVRAWALSSERKCQRSGGTAESRDSGVCSGHPSPLQHQELISLLPAEDSLSCAGLSLGWSD